MGKLAREAAANLELCGAVVLAAGVKRFDPIAIDYWVRGHFRYRGENREVIRTPAYMWEQWQESGTFEGDCDDVSTMLAFLLKCCGFKLVRYVAIRFDPADAAFSHVFVEVYYAGQWRVFDPTVPLGTIHNQIERMVENV